MTRTSEIVDTLKEFINPKCELIYHNNFELLISVMLSAQTTDKSVNKVTEVLFSKYPSCYELMDAKNSEVEEIIKTIGLSKTKAKNAIAISKLLVTNFNGEVPSTLEELTTLPGVGRKTANVVLALGFNKPAIPVDCHVSRVSKRLKIAKEEMTELEVEGELMKKLPKYKWIDSHHLLLLFGRYYCKAQHPLCDNCKMEKYCKKTNSK
ncbi:MAG: endonuclease III [Anaeroplasmataceae bacterium]